MNKNAIKKYAVWARNELISRVSFKAAQMGITEKGITEEGKDSVNGVLLTNDQKKQRSVLIARVKEKGFKEVIEETAYTWFNRFIALRYMEVNSLLPSMVRVFTDDSNNFKPQILDEAIHLEFDGLDKDRIYELKDKSDDEELYKYLLIAQCNALNNELPKMFDRLEDYMELLFPDNLLREGSVVEQMVTTIPQEDWQDQVQIIGWMYQYWNIEPKDAVFAGLKKNIKITKENIPAATQLFTPDWIVRYMVENSLGRAWKETHQDFDTSIWKYYLEESPENAGKVAATLENTDLDELTFLDPCMGSGHILVYAFDVFMNLYASRGVGKRDAVRNIITKNIFGIDLDKRAWQLSYFALKMKACQYDANFLSRGIEPNVYYMQDMNLPEGAELTGELKTFAEQFKHADVYGSLTPAKKASESVVKQVEEYREQLLDTGTKVILERMVETANVLDNKYSVVVTNPPYMGSGGMDGQLSDFIKDNYSDYKSDLFSAFIIKCSEFCSSKGFMGFLSPYVWMFIQSYEKLRNEILNRKHIETLIQFEYSAFEEATVPICTFVLRNQIMQNQKGKYLRLTDFRGGMEIQRQKALEAIENHKCGFYYETDSCSFSKIPGSPIAYWWKNFSMFEEKNIDSAYVSAGRNKTHNNDKYVRLWWEIANRERWQPYANGGDFRRWAGNDIDLVDWSEEAKNNYASHGGLYNQKFAGKEGVCWNLITSYKNGFRLKHGNHHYSSAAPTIISKEKDYNLIVLAFLNSIVSSSLLEVMNPTLNTTVGDVLSLPLPTENNHINELSQDCINISQTDWDSFETSWDFEEHPFVRWSKGLWDGTAIACAMDHYYNGNVPKHNSPIELCYLLWQGECNERFAKLKANEEELNRIFIDIYGLQEELTPEVEEKDVTVRKADLTREVKSFISYAVGCMFGRYSLTAPGLINASGPIIMPEMYGDFGVDEDNVIPVTDKAYFDDDITGRFSKFVEIVFGEETLAANLQFISDAIGGNGKEPLGVIRNYFLNDFYKDHCKMYQNKPIYWMFDAGKKNSFKALIYMHRYENTTIANLRTEYVHQQQTRLKGIIEDLDNRNNSASGSTRIKLSKELAEVKDQDAELHKFEEKIHHLADQMISIDLDDGVKHNYELFGDVLAKVK